MPYRLPLFVLVSLCILVLAGCDCAGDTNGGVGSPCSAATDCSRGLICVDRACAVATDSGPRPDGASDEDGGIMCEATRVCGAACCEAGQVCGMGLCCAPAELCGGACCGTDQTCEADRCVLDCGADRAACGTGAAATCCDAAQLCYLESCVMPGDPCTSTRDCPEGEYCETTAMRCLPRAMGEACEWRPPTGPFEAEEEWSWTGDATVLPAHNQVMMAPMVANLTDDNGDGAIDENDIPDIVFHTFTGSNYWGDGVLRVISGADGSRIWPTADPGYRTSPGGEIAIADVDPASPGPEVMACSPSTRPSTPGHLMILSAAGTLLRRFDTAPNDVPCGFDAPAVGDMDGDGTPEIVVRFVIAHADGTVVQRIADLRGSGGPYNALADVDGDMDLELVSAQGVWNYDGTAVWDRRVAGALPALPGGNIAIADLDLDGDAEIVVVGGGHYVSAIDAATGDDVWGPIDINPPEMAGVIAANGNPNGGGAPTIGNFDADPNPEIAFAGGFAYVVFQHDGTRLWWYETVDRSSRATGSSLFDFEGDGVAEVLYNDERTFRVFAGPDGSVIREQCNTSGTLREFPIVVDVDNDDRAEIVVMENNYAFGCLDGSPSRTGIHVYGHPRGEWVRTRRIFNQHTYHVTNIDEDGTVPTRETRHWTVERLNTFRLNVQPDGIFDAPDLLLVDLAAGTRMCPVTMSLTVRVVNRGAAGAPAGVPVTFYLVDAAGVRTRIGASVTTRPLLPGESELLTMTPAFPIPAGMELATFSFLAVLNDPSEMPLEVLHECRDENNESATLEARCPSVE